MIKKLCIYCGSSTGKNPSYIEGTRRLARILVDNKIDVVYGGASIGVMGALADAVLEYGGAVTGIIPEDLMSKEVAHSRITELKVVASMHERKAAMAEISDGFIALPGGIGTFEELFEILTWAQLGFHRKPVGLLNLNGYFDSLIRFLDHAVDEQFLQSYHRSMLIVESEPDRILERFSTYRSPVMKKWIDREST